MKIQDSNDLLGYLLTQADTRKDWFGFTQQRMTAVTLAHQIAKQHADKMTPDEVVEYALKLNQAIYNRIIKVT
ncbi:hypothetical protein UFOVP183_12 [uncultured Caudovirales phage]|jgi:hypothetical protein|uniref:Uncharacterized protein n=1 Tax=uncultured Caudovirales phage TaxID=2100421 RepID=A0A6J7WCQ7_9CAUD|nr:hypothetical protein UFOVP183_12 [uncultured Caudovirales phage]